MDRYMGASLLTPMNIKEILGRRPAGAGAEVAEVEGGGGVWGRLRVPGQARG